MKVYVYIFVLEQLEQCDSSPFVQFVNRDSFTAVNLTKEEIKLHST